MDSLLIAKVVLYKIVDDIQFHQRCAAHAIDQDDDIVSFIVEVGQIASRSILRVSLAERSFSVSPRFAMDADPDFHFVFGQFKARFPCGRNGARFNGHPHGTDISGDLFGNAFYVRQRCALFSLGTGNFMDENRTGYTRRPWYTDCHERRRHH